MTTSEKVAYLKGLCEGMDIGEDTKEGKLLKVIIDVLDDLALDLADTKDSVEDLADCYDELNEELADLEEEFYDCLLEDDEDDEEDDDDEEEDDEFFEDGDEPFYSVECPGCGFTLTVDEEILAGGKFECPECGEVIDFRSAVVEPVEFEDEEDEDGEE